MYGPEQILGRREGDSFPKKIYSGSVSYLLTRSKLSPGSEGGAPESANRHLSGPSDLTEPAIDPWSALSRTKPSPLDSSWPLSSAAGLPACAAFQANCESAVIARSIVVLPAFARQSPTRSVCGASAAAVVAAVVGDACAAGASASSIRFA